MELLRYKPCGLWLLDDDSPYTDYSGCDAAATGSSVDISLPLSSYTAQSRVFNNTNQAVFDSPIYRAGREGDSWSIAASTYHLNQTPQEYRYNLAPNPSFETDISGCTPNGVTASRSTEWSDSGSASLKLVPDGTSVDSFAYYFGGFGAIATPFKAGRTFTVSAAINTPTVQSSPSTRARKIVAFVKSPSVAGGAYVETPSNQGPASGTGRVSVTFSIPSDAKEAFIRFYNGSYRSDVVYWDSILIEETQTNSYFDGNTPGAHWMGTPNSSASAMPVDTITKPIAVLSNQNDTDGLSIDGNVVSFSTKYATTGYASASFAVSDGQRLDIVGIHTPQKNTLYINGVLVDEVDVSEAQRADVFAYDDPHLYCGYSSGFDAVAVNTFALFPRALTNDEVSRLYLANNTRASGSPSLPFDGREIILSTQTRHPYLDVAWNKDSDWSSAEMTNVSIEDDSIYAQMLNGLTLLGQWTDAIDLYEGDNATPIESLYLLWEGKNETVEASVDTGDTWVAVEKGVVLPIIPSGFDPTDTNLMIRVTLAADKDESYMSSMIARGFIGNTAESGGRQITYPHSSVPMDEYVSAILHDNWGVRFENGDSLIVGGDTSGDPLAPQTIEIWAKSSSGFYDTNINLLDHSTSNRGMLLINGWFIHYYTLSTPLDATEELTFTAAADGQSLQIGKIVLYPSVLTSEQLDTIFDNYFGITSHREDLDVGVAIAEPADSTIIYAHDWSTISS